MVGYRRIGGPSIIAVLALLASLLTAPAAQALPILYVSASGSDSNPCTAGQMCRTVGHAISVAPPGSVVEVGAGTYTEDNLRIDKSLTIRGVAPNVSSVTQLLAPTALATVLTTSNAGAGSAITASGGGDSVIALSNLRVVGKGTDAINVAAQSDSAIAAISFDHIAVTGSAIGINSTGSPIHGFSLTNSAVQCPASSDQAGVIPTSADGVGYPLRVTGNYLTGCGVGINAGNFAGFGTSRAVAGTSAISNNIMDTMAWSCIVVAMSFANLTVSGNTLTDCNAVTGGTGAIALEGLTPATSVTAANNAITATGDGSGGDIGIQIQNIPSSSGNSANFVLTNNRIWNLQKTNTSDAIRLGPTAIARSSDDISITISGNTLTGNTRGGSWQTNAGSTLQQNLNFTANRIANNVSRGFSVFSSGRTFNAQNNWWGCNEGPGTGTQPQVGTGCDSVGGITGPNTINLTPFTVMTIAPNPSSVFTGLPGPIRVLFNRNSDGQTISGIPPDTPVNFSSTLGQITSPALTQDSIGVATLTPPFVEGTTTVTAALDNQTVTRAAPIQVPVVDVAVTVPVVAVDQPAVFEVQAAVNNAPAPTGSVVTLYRVANDTGTTSARSTSSVDADRILICRATITTSGKGACSGAIPAGKWKIIAEFQLPGGPVTTPDSVSGVAQPVKPKPAPKPTTTVWAVRKGKRVHFHGQTARVRSKIRVYQAKRVTRPAKLVRTLRSGKHGAWKTTVRVRSLPTVLCVSVTNKMVSTFRVTKAGTKSLWSATRGDVRTCRR